MNFTNDPGNPVFLGSDPLVYGTYAEAGLKLIEEQA